MLVDEYSRRRLASIRGGETSRRKMLRSGFGPTGFKLWTEEEEQLIRSTYPDYALMRKALPHRTDDALKSRAVKIGITKPWPQWTNEQVSLLRKNYSLVKSQELVETIGRPLKSIHEKAQELRIKRPSKPFKPTGNDLLDALRERRRVLRYSMVDLDDLAGSGTYFQGLQWRQTPSQRFPWFSFEYIASGVLAIGGTLKVAWNDEKPPVEQH